MIPGLIFSVILILTISFVTFKIIWSKRGGVNSTEPTVGEMSKLDKKVISAIKFGEDFYFKIFTKTKIVTTEHIPNGFFGFLSLAKNKLNDRYYEIFSVRGNRVLNGNKRRSEFLRNMEVVRMNGNRTEAEKRSEI